MGSCTAVSCFEVAAQTAMAPAGLMRAALREAWHWVNHRTAFQRRLIDQPLIGGGWIEIRRDTPDEDITIWGHFTIALNGDFKDNRILADDKALQGHYDIESQTWELEIDFY